MSLQACTTPVPKVYTPALPVSRNTECKRCEMVVNIGLFFDGTGNNRDEDKPTRPKPGEKEIAPHNAHSSLRTQSATSFIRKNQESSMYKQVIRWLSSVMLLTMLAACAQGFSGKPAQPEMAATTLTGVGHLGSMTGIPQYFVDGHWGGNVPGWGGGGGSVCCVQLPAKIPDTPYMVTVQWRTCDVSHIKFVDGKRVNPKDRCIPSEHEATVPVHFEVPGGKGSGLKIHFLPGNKVEAWYTEVGASSTLYPGPAYSRGPAPDYAPVVDEPAAIKTQGDK